MGNSLVKISVVIPVYNVEPYLVRCLETVVAQSFDGFEIILVDDGSTDGSALTTIPLETDLKLHLGYVTADNRELSVMGERFVSHLARSLDLYANR